MAKSTIPLNPSLQKLHMPDNLTIGMMVAEQHEKCGKVSCDFDYYGFAFGQSPFPVPPLLSRKLGENGDAGGLSKDRSSGGCRLGVCVLPARDGSALAEAFEKMAATLYTSVATPIQRKER